MKVLVRVKYDMHSSWHALCLTYGSYFHSGVTEDPSTGRTKIKGKNGTLTINNSLSTHYSFLWLICLMVLGSPAGYNKTFTKGVFTLSTSEVLILFENNNSGEGKIVI